MAGLEPQYGLYSAFMGCFVYIVFGSSKDITIGPTAIMALMTGGGSYFYFRVKNDGDINNLYIAGHHAMYGASYAILLAFLSGLIILACGLLR